MNRLSMLAVLATTLVLSWTRIEYSELRGWTPMKVTTWDALAYYAYLPGTFIHDDIEHLPWVERIDSVYDMVGTGGLYQLIPLENGNRVNKCLYGVAFMELPAFLVAHAVAGATGFPQDGFSSPYQWAMGLNPLLFAMIGLLALRSVLLRWYHDHVVAFVLITSTLASNAIQYISVDGAQTHGYLFALYAFILWATVKWHEKPGIGYAALIGGIISLATFTRPTELIMLLIPLLWNTSTKEGARQKWALVRIHRKHILWILVTGVLIAAPQLIYWKLVTGSWIYELGSKWDFLNPHWRVLVGWEKGWFIYTPITVFFVIGLFFMNDMPWRKSMLTFTLLNIWIIIAWHDWRYGGSYSARALVQSYPVWALAFAALAEQIIATRWRWPFVAACTYLLVVNLWQIRQYNNGVIKYDGMTREEYQRVYLR